MANPQKENGYTVIANEILNAFRGIRIPGEARQVLDCIIRQTYGYNKKTDTIALSQFVEWTGMKKPEVCRALAKLQTMNLIVGEKANSRNIATKYGLNKNYDKWEPLAKKPTTIGEKANSISKKPLKNIEVPLAKKPPSKDNTKDNITKERGARPNTTINFFTGINDLIEKKETKESVVMKEFLQKLAEKYPKAPKELLWAEIKKFYNYWTEKSEMGTKERWQKQTVFQVDRRLVTWFSKINQFQRSEIKSKGKAIIGI